MKELAKELAILVFNVALFMLFVFVLTQLPKYFGYLGG